jgi:hypothetical protein
MKSGHEAQKLMVVHSIFGLVTPYFDAGFQTLRPTSDEPRNESVGDDSPRLLQPSFKLHSLFCRVSHIIKLRAKLIELPFEGPPHVSNGVEVWWIRWQINAPNTMTLKVLRVSQAL